MAQNFVSKAKWDFISTWLKTTGDNKPWPHLEEGLQKCYIHSRKQKPQMKNLECQTKEVGRVWVERGPPGKPELWPERDCRDLLPLCVNSEMSPIAHLNYRQVPLIYRKHPQTEKKHKSPCLLLSLYTAIYMMQSREIKTVPTATLVYVEHGVPPFSQGCKCLTRARDSLLSAFQRKATAQRAFSACCPRSDETAFWHTLSRPPVSGPKGAASRGLSIAKANQVPDEALRQDVNLGVKKFHPTATRNPRK